MASVVVVGAGVAGLTCAWRLVRAGHQVEVLERETRAGGRVRTEARGEFAVDTGASSVSAGHRNVRRLADALGLGARLRPLARSDVARVARTGFEPVVLGPRRAWLGARALSRGARVRLWRLELERLRGGRRLDAYRPELAASLDRENLARLLQRTAGREALEELIQPRFAALLDTPPEDLSASFALAALGALGDGAPRLAFEGGMGLLPRVLAERVSVRTGCEAIRVETAPDGARVLYRTHAGEGRLLADAAVVAVPGVRVPPLCPGLTPGERAFFEGVRYGRGIVVALLLDKEPPSLPGHAVGFRRRSVLDLRSLLVGHRTAGVAPPGTALLQLTLTAEASNRLWWAPDAAVAEDALDALARTPVGRVSPSEFLVQRWDPLLPHFEPGTLARLRAFQARRERSPRLAFAGDYLLGPWLEMAVTSGMRAATEIGRHLTGGAEAGRPAA